MTLSTRRKFWWTKPKLFCVLALLICVMSAACTAIHDRPEGVYEDDRPNILWLVLEDASPILAPYGDTTIDTPNMSRLAKEGITYTNVYSPSGVCSPSRVAMVITQQITIKLTINLKLPKMHGTIAEYLRIGVIARKASRSFPS